ncbi:hypothetical protein FB45DRAFT_1085537 [Roridomyces roridus]|uniref:F-box domain-containing protein n=1 Tax=Roridomyces roridus TaxID=1738132 RepID=A0AAD7F5Y4_9AGAR|nr:hypothetical protein FB45DRAFT_1085537 [Roridomyces roridus]
MALRCSQCRALSNRLDELDSTLVIASNVGTLARHSILINTNDAPQDSDRNYVRQVVSKADGHIACLDDEISRLENRVKVLARERELVSEYRRRNVGILSPVRRLPPEILCQIFAWSLPTTEDVKAPTRWRSICISNHSLWSMIHVDAAGFLPPSAVIQTQVQRARGLKIHFYGREDRTPTQQTQLFRFLSDYSFRWEELCLRLTRALVPCLIALSGKLPVLRRLWLEWDSPRSQGGVGSIECFREAPCLVNVGVSSVFDFIPVPLPTHHHITQYDLDARWEIHGQILHSLPHLVEARILVSLGGTWSSFEDKVSLPRLRRMYVSDASILGYLKAPALEQVAVHTLQTDAPEYYHESISALIARSACSLRSL